MILRASALLAALAGAGALCTTASAQSCDVASTSPLLVNVKDKGAKGDGSTDDTQSIQLAVDEVAGTGGTVYVPNGTYLLNIAGVQLKSNMTLKLADGAVLKMMPNDSQHYAVVKVADASDVTVIGGTLVGERAQHKNKQGQWGHGLRIGPNAARVTAIGVTSKEMWGDGFYVEGATDVAICSIVSSHNRRQGLSIIDVDRMLVTNSVFKDTRGTRPMAGIDMEPDEPTQHITNVRIENSKFIDNAGGGIEIAGKKGEVANVQITHNLFEGNRPIKIENAPRVRSTDVCDNRYVRKQEQTLEGFNAFAEPAQIVALQTDCGAGRDMRFEVNRISKKKKKKPGN